MKKLIYSLLLVAITFLFTRCYKVEPTQTVITAVNESKVPLENVKIIIRAQSKTTTPANINLADSGYTNGSGVIAFDFSDIYKDGQAGVAVLDIKGEIVIGGVEYEGFSYVQLEAGVNKSAKVIIRKKNT